MSFENTDQSSVLEYSPAQKQGMNYQAFTSENGVSADGSTYHIGNGRQAAQVDVEQADQWQREAEATNAALQAQNRLQAENDEIDYQRLTSTEKRAHLEHVYTPLLHAAKAKLEAACDALEQKRTTADVDKLQLQTEFASRAMHPLVKLISCSGQTHFAHLLRTGELCKDGYKFVDTMNGGHTLILIPEAVPSLMSLADTVEAKEYAQGKVDREIERLDRLRKVAAVEFTELKNTVRDKWEAITDFSTLFEDTVKRSKK